MSKTMHTLPPDLVVHDVEVTESRYWHLPRDPWDKINRKVTGKGIIIANLDTGINDGHRDIKRPIASRSFIPGQSALRDGNGHGSHTSGTNCGNDPAISPAFEADLIVGKVLSDGGSGGSDGIAAGIRWAAEEGAHIISMSLGGGGRYGPTEDAIDFATSKGAVVVASAGNAGFNGSRNTIGYPGKYLTTLCSGATQQNGNIAGFSSGGREMDFATPGAQIVSARSGGGRATMSGTSMSCPYLASLLALILELRIREGGTWITGADEWREVLKANVDDKGATGPDPVYGYGVPRYQDIVNALANDDLKWI